MDYGQYPENGLVILRVDLLYIQSPFAHFHSPINMSSFALPPSYDAAWRPSPDAGAMLLDFQTPKP